jgi:multiple sugar transport system ATP-binding protein
MASITFDHVDKIFGDVHVLKDLNIDIPDQEFLVLVGPSGCGKSTALRCLAGLEEITNGQILIGNRVVNNVPPKDRDIAMVFQSYALYPHMSVFDNMAFGLKLRKVPKPEIKKRVEEAAEMISIPHLLDRKPRQLSGGQRQRVALGRAIVRDPAVFLMDEPLSNLDAKLRVQTRAEISKLHQRLKTTFIYVTHDQTEAMTMGSRIAVMKDGVVQQLDTPQTLYDHPLNKFVAGFIGSPSMNFVRGTLRKGDGQIFFDSGTFSVPIPKSRTVHVESHVGKEVDLGVRPEDIHDASLLPPGIHDTAKVETTVDVTEPMGSEIYAYMQSGTHSFIGRFDPRTTARPGQPMLAVFDMDKMHIFDTQTEKALI